MDIKSLLSFLLISTVLSLLSSFNCKADSPSSCGNIKNISCPFTLKGDHQKCDASSFIHELSCINNRTILYLQPDKLLYYVERIDYKNLTMRIIDPGLQKNNYSSIPSHSISRREGGNLYHFNQPITVIQCPSPVISARYINITSPGSTSFSASVLGKYYVYSYAYIVAGVLKISNIEYNCRISKQTWISRQSALGDYLPIDSSKYDNIVYNLSEIHDAMVSGFDLHWAYFYCFKCDVATNGTGFFQNWHGLMDQIKRGKIREDIGKVIGIILGARFSLGIPFLLALLVYRARRRHLSMYDTIEDFLQAQNNLMPIRYAYSDIKKITNNFKDKLGEGGFGTVYKGKLRSGLFVAVKILDNSKATGKEFINEVATSGRIHHINVVQLLGFCFQGPKRALIYEFMPNGSLEKYIFRNEGKEEEIGILSWEKMYEISCKVASGIDHFDIKPHNILLDKNFNPTISDFGLAKLYATDDSIVTLTAARGTMGYMAPEMFYKNIGGISYKADIYSFGMLLMEMAGRRKNLNPFVDDLSQIHFSSWVYDQFSEGKELEMENATQGERKLVKKMIIVALWCIQMKPSERPSMNKVIEMLEGDIEHLIMPPKPFLYPHEEISETNNLLQADEK
ncbi:rust resistance kinase Lr10-like isoform X2 [Apium graveolens]|uniref:rust resistance kinase Lr10-like isoform X2 n=1 Tax=Apium graveolens TaxID=4045 RepID=UPI003D7AE18B